MKKTLILVAVFGLFAAIAGAQCSTSISIIGSGLYAGAQKCYGTMDTYNAMANRGGFYYDYEYSAFTKSPIACETPVTNTDTVTFIGRSRNWGNNGACATLYGCPTPAAGLDSVYASWGTNASNFLTYFIMESCPYVTTSYQCAGTGLGARVANASCNGLASGVDYQFHFAAPALSPTLPCVPATGCTVGVTITVPTAGSGLYGPDGVSMISGYRIYLQELPLPNTNQPTSGAIAGWTASNYYIPANGIGSFTHTFTTGNNLFVSYAPIFNNRAGTAIATLAANGMQPTGFVGPFLGFSPTPTTFESFTGHYADLQTVNMNWVTASENDAMGFNLYRSLDGVSWTKVNPTLIQAMGQGGGGSSYAYTDNLPKQRTYQAWQYKVEELSNAGSRIADTTTEVTK
jgi:hypothetical protein